MLYYSFVTPQSLRKVCKERIDTKRDSTKQVPCRFPSFCILFGYHSTLAERIFIRATSQLRFATVRLHPQTSWTSHIKKRFSHRRETQTCFNLSHTASESSTHVFFVGVPIGEQKHRVQHELECDRAAKRFEVGAVHRTWLRTVRAQRQGHRNIGFNRPEWLFWPVQQ